MLIRPATSPDDNSTNVALLCSVNAIPIHPSRSAARISAVDLPHCRLLGEEEKEDDKDDAFLEGDGEELVGREGLPPSTER